MGKLELSEERQRRLAELRAKYPKPVPSPSPEHHTTSLTLSLRFEYKVLSQEEADKAAYDWIWKQGHDISNLLMNRYAKDGLRGVSLFWEVKQALLDMASEDEVLP